MIRAVLIDAVQRREIDFVLANERVLQVAPLDVSLEISEQLLRFVDDVRAFRLNVRVGQTLAGRCAIVGTRLKARGDDAIGEIVDLVQDVHFVSVVEGLLVAVESVVERRLLIVLKVVVVVVHRRRRGTVESRRDGWDGRLHGIRQHVEVPLKHSAERPFALTAFSQGFDQHAQVVRSLNQPPARLNI